MFTEIYRTKEEFTDSCRCAYEVLNFVADIKDTDVMWFFDTGYYLGYEDRYSIIFKSYVTEEYQDYILSIEVKKKTETGEYDLRIHKKIDNLLK